MVDAQQRLVVRRQLVVAPVRLRNPCQGECKNENECEHGSLASGHWVPPASLTGEDTNRTARRNMAGPG